MKLPDDGYRPRQVNLWLINTLFFLLRVAVTLCVLFVPTALLALLIGIRVASIVGGVVGLGIIAWIAWMTYAPLPGERMDRAERAFARARARYQRAKTNSGGLHRVPDFRLRHWR